MAAAQSSDGKAIVAINITPMVDIILVLLVIFMVTSSAIHAEASIEVDKPNAATGSAGGSEVETLVLTCDESGAYFAGEQALEDGEAIRRYAEGVRAEMPEVQAVLRCDRAARVDVLVTAIDALRQAGIQKYAIATAPLPAPNAPAD